MKILIVCSANSGKVAPFIQEQVDALTMHFDVECFFFLIKEKGPLGYLRHLPNLKDAIEEYKPDLIHAHYGYSGLLANLQRKIPVVTTYPGSDINELISRFFSVLSIGLSISNIFMTNKQKNKVKNFVKKNTYVMPYGILIDTIKPIDKNTSRMKLGFEMDENLVLFSSKFSREGKNAPLAFSAVNLLEDVKLLELTGTYTKEEMNYIFNAVDVCLMTSISEGSPQFIKEAMACNCPIVSVNVGDVKEVISHTEGCYVSETYKKEEIAEKIKMALQFGQRTTGRERIIEMGLDTKSVSEKLMQIYNQAINR